MPFVVPAALAASITVVNGTFTLVQNCYKLAAVDEDLAICLELLADADRDLNYVRHQLRSRKSSHSQFSYIDMEYFEAVVEKAERASLSLGQLIEGYRVQQDVKNSVSIGSRFKWVLQGKDKFANRQDVLRMAHISLVGVIQRLGNVVPYSYNPQASSAPPPPYNPPINPQISSMRDAKILRSPSQQRALRGKSSKLLPFEDQGLTATVTEIQQPYSPYFLPSVPRDVTSPAPAGYTSRVEYVMDDSESPYFAGNF